MERPFVSNVEEFINGFIKAASGSLVIDRVSGKPAFKNCDYFFEKENVLIELKCLEKDIFSDTDYERNERLYDKWLSNGILKKVDLIPIMLGRKDVPKECLVEIVALCRRTFESCIEKASEQLNATKKEIGNDRTWKVLFICNDGNYFLDDLKTWGLISTILGIRTEWEIDCCVLFTVNQASRSPESDLDITFWAPSYRSEEPDGLESFINKIGEELFTYYNTKFGITDSRHTKYPSVDEGLEAIKKQKHIPNEVIYGKKRK